MPLGVATSANRLVTPVLRPSLRTSPLPELETRTVVGEMKTKPVGAFNPSTSKVLCTSRLLSSIARRLEEDETAKIFSFLAKHWDSPVEANGVRGS